MNGVHGQDLVPHIFWMAVIFIGCIGMPVYVFISMKLDHRRIDRLKAAKMKTEQSEENKADISTIKETLKARNYIRRNDTLSVIDIGRKILGHGTLLCPLCKEDQGEVPKNGVMRLCKCGLETICEGNLLHCSIGSDKLLAFRER